MSLICFAVALLSVGGLISQHECLEMKTFSKIAACPNTVDETLLYQFCFEKQACRSLVECCTMCNLNSTCLGVFKSGTKTSLYFHRACSFLDYTETCNETPFQIHMKYTPVSCGIGASFNATTNECQCKLGWSGAKCDTAPKDCTALLSLSYTTGSYWIETVSPTGGSTTPIFCELTSSSAFRLYVFRNDGRSNHNKTWSEYVSGYKIDDNNFWLGLDAMNSYTKLGGKTLRMFAVFENDVVSAAWSISGVKVENETYQYQITSTGSGNSVNVTSPYSASVSNCLNSGIKFSTWDSDNDGNGTVNLASASGAGWFFTISRSCNPLGRLRSTLSPGETDGEIILPSLDMVNGGFATFFKYVTMYFE